jgi:hypothetical protein
LSERQRGCARSTLNNFIDDVAAGTYSVPEGGQEVPIIEE